MMHVGNSLSCLGAFSARHVLAWSSRGGAQRAHPWLPSAAPPALVEWTTPLGEWADLIRASFSLSFCATKISARVNFAMIYNGLNEKDQALAYLERSLQEREVQITFIKIDTRWDELRTDPRFQEIMRRVGLPP